MIAFAAVLLVFGPILVIAALVIALRFTDKLYRDVLKYVRPVWWKLVTRLWHDITT
jgi:hypothetical protein